MSHNEFQQQIYYDKIQYDLLIQELEELEEHYQTQKKILKYRMKKLDIKEEFIYQLGRKPFKPVEEIKKEVGIKDEDDDKGMCRKCKYISPIVYDRLCYLCYRQTLDY